MTSYFYKYVIYFSYPIVLNPKLIVAIYLTRSIVTIISSHPACNIDGVDASALVFRL